LKERGSEIKNLKAKLVQATKDNEAVEAILEQNKKADTELQKVEKEKVRIESKLNKTIHETKNTLKEKKAEIKESKTVLQKARFSPPNKTSIMDACEKEKEAKIAQLNATIDHLSKELTNAKATIVFEDNETSASVLSQKY
jgi:hypothetical protein